MKQRKRGGDNPFSSPSTVLSSFSFASPSRNGGNKNLGDKTAEGSKKRRDRWTDRGKGGLIEGLANHGSGPGLVGREEGGRAARNGRLIGRSPVAVKRVQFHPGPPEIIRLADGKGKKRTSLTSSTFSTSFIPSTQEIRLTECKLSSILKSKKNFWEYKWGNDSSDGEHDFQDDSPRSIIDHAIHSCS